MAKLNDPYETERQATSGVESAGGKGDCLPNKNTGARVFFAPSKSNCFWALICPECVCGRGLRPGPRWGKVPQTP